MPLFRVDQIDHVELFVPDRCVAAWYERTLGLTIAAEYEYWADNPAGPSPLAKIQRQTPLFESSLGRRWKSGRIPFP